VTTATALRVLKRQHRQGITTLQEAIASLEAEIRKAKASSRALPRVKAPGATKEERDAADARAYARAKVEAAERAGKDQPYGIRCEVVTVIGGQEIRCPQDGHDPHHALGGAMRKECERLGAEGLIVCCRMHHDMDHASTPTREFWLDVKEEHALRHGYRRLLALLRRARAKYEGKHPEARP
jgi:hypothetical protein